MRRPCRTLPHRLRPATLMLALVAPLAAGLLHAPAAVATGPETETHHLRTDPARALDGQMVTFEVDGREVSGYASGLREGVPTVLVVHEWWGLNDYVKQQAEQLRDLGYGVFAIDLYGGKVATDPQTASRYATAAREEPAPLAADLAAAIDHLDALSGGRVATLGWCFGGGWALRAALASPEQVDAAVSYYGEPVLDVAELRRLEAPLLAIFATDDDWITPAKAAAFETALEQAGANHEVHHFEAEHAFANPSNPDFDAEAARQASDLTRDFLMAHLRSPGT